MILLAILIVFLALAAFDVASMLWGADSRPGAFGSQGEIDPAKYTSYGVL